MNAQQLLEQKYIVLKKAVSKLVILNRAIKDLGECKFKILHSSNQPLNLRFTFIDDSDEKSIYLALDVKDGVAFELYTIAADFYKTFEKFEIYADVDVLIHLNIEEGAPSFQNQDTIPHKHVQLNQR
jgi:hypothetical protein